MFSNFAKELAELSTCKRLKVGCVVVDPELSGDMAIGYNGPPAGVSNDACRSEEGACGCIHGEANALIKLRTSKTGLVMFTTVSPCEHCAGLIINSRRIGYVIFQEAYRDDTGLELLFQSGIVVVQKHPIGSLVSVGG